MPGGLPLGLEVCNGTSVATSGSSGTTVTTGASNTMGSFVQLVSSTSSDTCWIVVQADVHAVAGNRIIVNVAVGGAGSEKIIANNLLFPASGTEIKQYSFPISISAGTRISAQAQSTSATDTPLVSLILFDGAFTQIEGPAGVDVLAINTATTNGASVAAGSSGVKGSYVQLISSTTQDYMGLIVCLGTVSGQSTTSFGLMDIAIGGSGAEVPIIPNLQIMIGSNDQYPDVLSFFTPVPAGTRISARCSVSTASAVTAAIGLYGIYQ